ncbi:MAG: hypothetical protein KatS3mg059_1636 [Thermomicrobiales bacterium]|nr:MAG: hypothetical protein KatS3mg059_1636 [Thermomicrobiales bacterium]
MRALGRVRAVERLVHEQHVGIVHEGGRDLDALAHTLGIPTESSGPAAAVMSTIARAPARRQSSGLRQALKDGVEPDEFAAGEERVELLVLRHEPEVPVDARIAADGLPKDGDSPWPVEGASKPGQELEGGGFACPVRAKERR